MSWRGNPLLGYWRRGCEFPTKAEASLEPAIAALGKRYRHQYPFWGLKYFADFALLDDKIIIEVDGDSHDKPEQKEKDLLHTLAVLELGWRVVRVTNEEALRSPEASVAYCLALAANSRRKDAETQILQGALDRLRRDYPELLVAHAKRSKLKTQRSKAAAQTRRLKKSKASSTASAGGSPRKRATPAPSHT